VPDLPTKTCLACGRSMTWRKAWARSWDEVRYCSTACRRRGVGPLDRALEAALLALLDSGGRGALVDPDEAAALVAAQGASAGVSAGVALREPARSAARRLVASGAAEIVVAGRVVDPSRARGPIALRRVSR